MKIARRRTINAPASEVWRVLAHEFDRIGDWATAIPASRPAPNEGRVCSTALRRFPEVEERIVASDESERTLTYEAARGMPAFITVARNRWRVETIGRAKTRVSCEATLETRGLAGRMLGFALRLQLRRTGRLVLSDLAHFLEHSRPSPRKRRQLEARRLPQAEGTRHTVFETSRVVPASRDRVWEVVSDVAGLAAHAPNLSATEVVAGDGEGLIRRCHNNGGKGWNETCTLWNPGHRYTMEVDTSDYPYPLRTMRGTWAVEDEDGGTRIRLHYEYEFRYGVLGGALAVLMRPAFAWACRQMLDSYERALGIRTP